MRTPELEKRHHASAVIARMLLTCCRAMLQGYDRQKNIAAVLPELLVAMAIRINDDEGKPPISINAIAANTGLPRTDVRRWLVPLIRQGVIVKSGGGYIDNDAYMQERADAPYFKQIVAAIREAAEALQDI